MGSNLSYYTVLFWLSFCYVTNHSPSLVPESNHLCLLGQGLVRTVSPQLRVASVRAVWLLLEDAFSRWFIQMAVKLALAVDWGLGENINK